MSIGTREEVPAPGRPRDPRIEDAVLDATVTLLVERGYAALNLTDVARRARTTKPAIYRRWRGKAHLVHEAAFRTYDAEVPELDGTGDGTLRGDLRVMVAATARMLSTPAARAALPGLVAEFQADPQLHAALLERFRDGPIARVAARLADAAASGQARADLDPEAVIEAIAGSVLFALLLDVTADLGPVWVDRTTDLLLRGIAR